MRIQAIKTGLFTALIILCVALFLRNAPHIWDLQMWDETFYMAAGLFNWNHHFRHYEASPLYSYIYRMTWHFIHDPAILHLWMGVAVVAVAIIVTALSVMTISRSMAFTAIITVIMLASGYSEALPKLVYAAIAIISTGFAISTLLSRLHAKMACIALTTFIVSFIRPEFVVGFYLSSIASVILLIASYRAIIQNRLQSSVTLGLLIIIAILVKLWTFPLLSGGARALQAFGQHYSLYLFNIGKVTIDPFLNYEKILAEYLPGATSETDALKKFPGSIFNYFIYNIESAIKAFFTAITDMAMNHTVVSVAIIALIVYCLIKRKHFSFNFGDTISWLFLAAPTAISIVLVFASGHYLVIAATLLMLFAALLVRSLGPRDTFVGAAAILILTAITVKPLPSAPQPHFETAMALRSQTPFGTLLELDGGWCYYASENCHSIYAIDIKSDNMVRYLDEDHINGVMVSAPLQQWAKENNLFQFTAFLENGASGWVKIPLSPDYTLLRRESLDT